MARAWLSLGSNIAPEANLRAAAAALHARFSNLLVSPLYHNRAIGFDGDDFLNAAVGIDTELDPSALQDWLHALEIAYGRDRSGPRFGDRPLDIDIVFYEALVADEAGHLQIPRPEPQRAELQHAELRHVELRHAFVLKPLFDIAPDLVDPRSGRTLAQLWAAHPERDEPRWSRPTSRISSAAQA